MWPGALQQAATTHREASGQFREPDSAGLEGIGSAPGMKMGGAGRAGIEQWALEIAGEFSWQA